MVERPGKSQIARSISISIASVAGAPAHFHLGVHVRWGNFKGYYLATGSYESVAERLFSRTRVNHVLLDYDPARRATSSRCAKRS
jgi:hypothetical protein